MELVGRCTPERSWMLLAPELGREAVLSSGWHLLSHPWNSPGKGRPQLWPVVCTSEAWASSMNKAVMSGAVQFYPISHHLGNLVSRAVMLPQCVCSWVVPGPLTWLWVCLQIFILFSGGDRVFMTETRT